VIFGTGSPGVFGRIGDLSIYWLVLALALKTAESVFIALGWRNILRAAYPRGGLSFKTAWGASQGGTAINAVTPAQAGTAVMIGIFRSSVRGYSVAASATVVQSLFFTAVNVLMLIGVVIFRPRAFSVTQDSVLTIWNVVLGVVVMLWAFGFQQVKELLRKSEKRPQEQPSGRVVNRSAHHRDVRRGLRACP
jgi:hypothetical protein